MKREESSGDSGSSREALRRGAILALVGVGPFFVPEGLDRILLRPPGTGGRRRRS